MPYLWILDIGYYSHRLLLNLTEKVSLKRSEKYVALSNLSTNYSWKNIKKVMQKQWI